MAKAFVKQNWNNGFDEKGRPIWNAEFRPKPMGGIYVEPGTQGGTNWYPPLYSPRTGLFYVSVWDNYGGRSAKFPVPPVGGRPAVHGHHAAARLRRPRRRARRGGPRHVQEGRRRIRRDPRARSEDRREEVGLQDGRLHGVGRALDRR